MTEAYGWPNGQDNGNFTGESNYPGYWEPSISKVEFGLQNYAVAEANNKFTAFSMTNGPSSVTAQVERWGIIASPDDGNVIIEIPYSFVLNLITDEPRDYVVGRVTSWIRLYSYPGFQIFESVDFNRIDETGDVHNYSGDGLLSLSVDDLPELQNGIQYRFEIGAAAQVWHVHVPEPATLLLFGLGLMGLAGVRRKIKKELNTEKN